MLKLKKINCLILSFVLLLISFTVSLKVKAETIKIGVINEPGTVMMGVVLRSDAYKPANSDDNKIITLWTGDTLTIIGSKNDVKGTVNKSTGKPYIWYQGTITKSGVTYTGYIREGMIDISEYNTDPTFEQQLSDFPKSYHDDLIKLHAIYPNWKFKADKLNVTFQEAIELESVYPLKVVVDKNAISWSSMGDGWYNWHNNSFVTADATYKGASREILAYYMDPRNFLDANYIYVFMQQKLNGSETIDGVRKILKGTFLENNYSDKNDTAYGGDFAAVIMEAAKQSGVSPYFLAATIRQEQGINGNALGNGYNYNGTVVYNFFNVKASGTGNEIIVNGGKHAFNKNWTTRSASIIGGAKFYADTYMNRGNNLYNNAYYNQDTCFYKNFNILDVKYDSTTGEKRVEHQYAQNVADSVSSASNLKILSTDLQLNLTFRIPVYANNSLPQSISQKPENSSKLNNYYFKNISVSGLTPAFERYTYNYSLQVNGDTNINVSLLDKTVLYSKTSFDLVKGDNIITLSVKSETGYINNYYISIYATTPCKLNITTNGDTETPSDQPQTSNILKGDANNDGKISVSDLAAIRLHLLEISTLKGAKFSGADANRDGKVSVSDLAAVRLHLLGIKTL